jgi:hypothetical protein
MVRMWARRLFQLNSQTWYFRVHDWSLWKYDNYVTMNCTRCDNLCLRCRCLFVGGGGKLKWNEAYSHKLVGAWNEDTIKFSRLCLLSAGQHSNIVTESSHCFRNEKETQDALFAQNLSCQINLPNIHASTKDCCMRVRKEDWLLRKTWGGSGGKS